jgi:Cdc6-like AAA superfamily ATPase
MQTSKNEMTAEEKIQFVDGIRVMYPAFTRALDLIEETHKEGQGVKHPLSMLVYGPSGSGKTTIMEAYLASKQKSATTQTAEGKSVSTAILSVEIPSPATYVAVTENLLKQLGDRYFSKGTASQKVDRLGELIKRNKVQLIMADEFQHFVDRDKKTVALRVSDWFKSLINHTQVPIILFGLESAIEVLDVNPQLSRRIPTRVELGPFKHDEEYLGFLQDLEEQLSHVFEKQSHLTDPDMSQMLFSATDGVLDSIMMLIRRAARIAIEKNRERIEKVDLAAAFARYGHLYEGEEVNPFLVESTLEKVEPAS